MAKKNRLLAIVLSFVLVFTLITAVSYGSSIEAAETFVITNPIDNQLRGAGHIDIEWTPATSSTVKDYQVYIDGQMTGTTTDTSYEYYTTKVKVFTVYIKARFVNGTSVNTDEISFAVTKKGLAVNDVMGKYLDPVKMNMGWYYTWGTTPFSYTRYKEVDFVPMIWGTGNNGNIPAVRAKNYKYVLGYNEPDMTWNYGGSNINVDTAINDWGLFQGIGNYVGAPAPAQSPSWSSGTWFRTFMNGIDQNTVDFIPLHCYYGQYGGAAGANAFLTEVVDETYQMYHKPVWITEFAVSGWKYDNAQARESVKEFLKTAIDGLNERDYVVRYSWFSFDSVATDSNGASALWTNSTGELTELGRVYTTYGNPEGYVAPEPVEAGYTVKESIKKEQLPDSITLKGITCEDYVNAEGVTATASSSINKESGPDKAIDDNITSRWESEWSDPQSITIDFGKVRNIKQIDIIWESASARDYTVQVSTDGNHYTKVASVEAGSRNQNRYDSIVLKQMASGRYVKINGSSRTTDYGYSIFDIAIYGTDNTDVNETTTQAPTTKVPVTTQISTTKSPATTKISAETSQRTTEQNSAVGNETTKRSDSNLNGTEQPATQADEKNIRESATVSISKTKIKKATKKRHLSKIKISLKKIKGAKKYQIKISTSKKFKKKLFKKTVKKVKVTIHSKKFKNKKKLFVKARAINIIENKKYYGDWSNVKKVKVKQ